MKCKSCDGRGAATCPRCKGKGRVSDGGVIFVDFKECHHCHGHGKKKCGVCNGRGSV